ERTVYQQLLNHNIETFFPSLKVKPKNPRAAKVRPYFPGYLFIHVDLENVDSLALKWMPGTKGLVSFGDTPALVPENLIIELRKRIAAIEAAGGLRQTTLQAGDSIKIVEGPFAGYEAIFDAYLSGSERVQILLSFLSNRPKRIRLDREQIEKVDPDKKP
ncbi:MAG: transcription termination/antitermination NusG family protein, partial [Chloroflexota bacterium]